MFPLLRRLAAVTIMFAMIAFFAACEGKYVAADDDGGDGGESTEFAMNNVDLNPVVGSEMAVLDSPCNPGWDGCPEKQ